MPTKKGQKPTKKRQKTKRRRAASSSPPAGVPARGTPATATGADGARDRVPIVAVGFSASRLGSCADLVRALPESIGMSFIFVEHRGTGARTDHAAALAKVASLPVAAAKVGKKPEPDHIYVIPPDASIALADGSFAEEPNGASRPMPVDRFLRSLAADNATSAIGVLLSGDGTDGMLGLEAIKANGGFTYAEDPRDGGNDDNLRVAIATGCIDRVLPPAEIAHELARLGKPLRELYSVDADAVEPGKPEDMRRIFAVLRASSGVDFTLYRQTTIRRRILRRMVLHRIGSFADYATRLREQEAEVQALFQDMLIRVTSFFRDPAVFSALQQDVFPALLANRTHDDPIRVWVPGCATGEEAYSLAMALLETMGGARADTPLQVFATDVSDSAIDKARAGLYPPNIAIDVSPERLKRFFVRVAQGYQIDKAIRDLCIFARQNVTNDPPFSRLDLVSCRNVFIYLEPALQKRVLPVFHYALKPSGVLVLGTSETVSSQPELFTVVDKKNKIYSKSPRGGAARVQFGGARVEGDEPARVEAVHDRVRSEASRDLERDIDRAIMSRYAPPGVVINDELQILQFRGYTGAFLEPAPGEPSMSLLKMAREGLLIELRAAIQRAQASHAAVRTDVLTVRANGESRKVIVEVFPLEAAAPGRDGARRAHHWVVTFEEVREQAPSRARAPEKKSSTQSTNEAEKLQKELASTREYLQSIIEEQEATNEELQSANEEILSSNEELQSINEELETAKEELQSTNEELTTVNEELQNRNVELLQANADLTHSLGSVDIPIVMLNADLRIRRYTPSAERVLHLVPTDIGRPIGDIKPRFTAADLDSLVREATSAAKEHQEEVRDDQGRWYSLRIRPYRMSDRRADGVAICLVDIDALKQSRAEIEQWQAYAAAIVATLREPLIVLDGGLRVTGANQAFYDTFRVEPAATQGRFVYDLGDGQWNVPSLRHLLEEILPKNREIHDYRVEHDFPKLGHRVFVLNARQLHRHEGATAILLAVEDVTGRATSGRSLGS